MRITLRTSLCEIQSGVVYLFVVTIHETVIMLREDVNSTISSVTYP